MNETEKNHQLPPDPSAASPRVGIFWIFSGELICDSVPVADGEEYGDFVNGCSDHCTFWPRVQRARPETRPYAYEQVPRGRVVYRRPDATFCVYGSDRFVRNEADKQRVMSAFRLPPGKVTFRADEHYGWVPGMPEE